MPPSKAPSSRSSFGRKVFHFFLYFFAVIGVVSTCLAVGAVYIALPFIKAAMSPAASSQSSINIPGLPSIPTALITTLISASNTNHSLSTSSATGKIASPSVTQAIVAFQLYSGLKNYFSRNGSYPTSLTALVPTYMPSIPATIDGIPYQYHTTGNGAGYEFCTTAGGQQKCINQDTAASAGL